MLSSNRNLKASAVSSRKRRPSQSNYKLSFYTFPQVKLTKQKLITYKLTFIDVSSPIRNNFIDNQFVTDLFAEVIGILAQSRYVSKLAAKDLNASIGSYSRFNLVKRKFSIEFNRLRNSNTLNNSEFIIKLLMGMKYFRIKVLK
jgi:hypothetical protein